MSTSKGRNDKLQRIEKKPRRITTPFHEFSPYENGRVRNLKFDVNALADFEQETGMGFAELFSKRAVFAAARALIWAGLKHEDRMLSIERVGQLISEYLQDEEVEPESHSVDTIIQVTLAVAVDQGALGRAKKAEEPAPTSPSMDPNDEGDEQDSTIVN
jgi:hypothetical protein